MSSASQANIELGNDLDRRANAFVSEASTAFNNLDSLSQNMLRDIENLDNKVNDDKSQIAKNLNLVQEASDHANGLHDQAMALQGEIENAKTPVVQALSAANAYSNIAQGLKNASDSAEKAMEAAEAASSIVKKKFTG